MLPIHTGITQLSPPSDHSTPSVHSAQQHSLGGGISIFFIGVKNDQEGARGDITHVQSR